MGNDTIDYGYNPLNYLQTMMPQPGPQGGTAPANIPPSVAPSPATPSQPGGQFDFSGMLDQYRQMAQRAYPTNQMFGNTQFGQNHPRLAGAINNAFMAAAMTKPGMTIGENISNVAGGVLGARQAQREQLLRQQMLPYQMIAPQMEMQKTSAEIANLLSEPAWRHSMEERNQAMSEWYARRVQQPNSEEQRMGLAASMAGITNWDGDYRKLSPDQAQAMGKALDQLTERQANAMAGGGLTPGHIVQMQMSDDPKIKAQGDQAAKLYTGMMGQVAGTRTGAEQAAPHPQADMDKFIDTEKANYRNLLPPKQSEEEFSKLGMNQFRNAADIHKDYLDQVESVYDARVTLMDKSFAQWQASTAPQQRIGFREYLDNREKYPPAAVAGAKSQKQGPTTGGPQSFSTFMAGRNKKNNPPALVAPTPGS